MKNEIVRVAVLAHCLRGAIEGVPREEMPYSMRHFPSGACGDAAQLLGAYFADSGVHGFAYFLGKWQSGITDRWSYHAWLQRQDLVVDIAADQFEDAPSAVIVSTNSSWHRSLEFVERGPADFRQLHGFGLVELGQLYSRLRAVLVSWHRFASVGMILP